MSDDDRRDPDLTRLDGDGGDAGGDSTTLDPSAGSTSSADGSDSTTLDPGTTAASSDGTRLDHADDRSPDSTALDASTGGVGSDGVDGDAFHTIVNLPSALRADYRILREIPTQGAEADVLVAEHRTSGRQVAVKVYRFQRTPPPQGVLDTLDAANRAHVVDVIDRGMSDGRWYEVLEFCAHGSLRDLIDHEGPKLSQERVRAILDEIVPALAHLHDDSLRITHRDLKPANVLVRSLRPTFDLVLTDFGLSRSMGAESKVFAATASRTVLYAAPEAAFGAVSPALDWWSLGIMIIEMLTGRHPLAPSASDGTAREEQVIGAFLATNDVPVDEVEEGRWRDLCGGLTTRSSEHRWGLHEVTEWMEGGAPRIRRTAPTEASTTIMPVSFAAPDGDEILQYRDPVRLAGVMGHHWDEALGVVANDAAHRRQHRQLADFLRTAGLPGALEVLQAGEGTPTDRLLRLRIAMDPETEPVFDGVDLAEGGLRRLAANGASGDARAAEITAGILEHGALTLYDDGSAAREGWAALEAQWARNWDWIQAQLQSHATRLEGARDLDAAQRNTMCAQILHLLLDDEARQRVAADGEIARSDGAVRDVAWFQTAARPSGSAPSPARDIVIRLLHRDAQQEADQRRQQAERARREERQRARAALGGALGASLRGILAWGFLGGLAAYITTVAGPLWTSTDPASVFGLAALRLWPYLVAAVAIGLVSEIIFSIATSVNGLWRGFARPVPPWHRRTVALAAIAAFAAPAIVAGGIRNVAGTTAGWALCAAAIAHLLCLTARRVLPLDVRAQERTGARMRSDAMSATVAVALLVAVGFGWIVASRAKAAEHRDFAQQSREVAQGITGSEWKCQPAPKPSPRSTAWMKLRVRCVHGATSAVMSEFRTQRLADAEFREVTGADRRSWGGTTCEKGSHLGAWYRDDNPSVILGDVACWSSQGIAFVAWRLEPDRRFVLMQRPGALPWLADWWRHQGSVFQAAS